jgi:hypothetical protein
MSKQAVLATVSAVGFAAIVALSPSVQAGETPNGKPFLYLQDQVDGLAGDVTALDGRVDGLDSEVTELGGRVGANEQALQRQGTQVPGHPGLYDVHTRVLWTVGWLHNLPGGFFAYNEFPTTSLLYGNGTQSIILSPLQGYGVPPVQDGATRRARLYVTYSHQWMCAGEAVTVRIGDVDFDLPTIHGSWVAPAANWSDFVPFEDYEHVGHTTIKVFLKDYYWDGPHCNPTPGNVRGAIYRVEAHFYDDFGSEE